MPKFTYGQPVHISKAKAEFLEDGSIVEQGGIAYYVVKREPERIWLMQYSDLDGNKVDTDIVYTSQVTRDGSLSQIRDWGKHHAFMSLFENGQQGRWAVY